MTEQLVTQSLSWDIYLSLLLVAVESTVLSALRVSLKEVYTT